MKVSGDAVLHASPEAVYAALNDPTVLVRAIPGCETLEALGGDRYRMAVTAGVASVRGTYDGEVGLSDQRPPESFTLHALGTGAPGTVEATVRVTLAAAVVDGGAGTRVAYDAVAVVGGMVGGVGQRMLVSVSRRMAGDFFAAVDRELTGTAVPTPPQLSVPGVAIATSDTDRSVEPGAVFRAPPRTSPGYVPLLAAAAVGAAAALAGVALGWRLARRR